MSDAAAIAEVLAEHTYNSIILNCDCNMFIHSATDMTKEEHAAHQAEVIAPIVQEFEAEAWDAGTSAYSEGCGEEDCCPIPPNPYKENK